MGLGEWRGVLLLSMWQLTSCECSDSAARLQVSAEECRIDFWRRNEDDATPLVLREPACVLRADKGKSQLVVGERALLPRLEDDGFSERMDLLVFRFPEHISSMRCGDAWTKIQIDVARLWTVGSPIGGGAKPLVRTDVWCLDGGSNLYVYGDLGTMAVLMRAARSRAQGHAGGDD